MRGRFSCWILSPVWKMPQHRRHVHIVLFMMINPVWCLRFVRAKPVFLRKTCCRELCQLFPQMLSCSSPPPPYSLSNLEIVFWVAKGAFWFPHPHSRRSKKRCAWFVISQVCSSLLRALRTYLLSKLFLIIRNPRGNPPPLLGPHFSPFVPMNNSLVNNWAFPFPFSKGQRVGVYN